MKNFTNYFLDKSVEVCNNLEVKKIEKLVKELKILGAIQVDFFS